MGAPTGPDRQPRESTLFRRLPHPGVVEILHATYITQTFPRHTHDQFAVGVIERGAQRFECERRGYEAVQGQIITNNPGAVHTGRALDGSGWTYRMFYVAPALLQGIETERANPSGSPPAFPNPVITDTALADRLRRLHRALLAPTSHLERDERLLTTLATLLARHTDRPRRSREAREEPGAVAQIRDYLHAHYAEEVTLAELGALTGLGPLRALRAFRAASGLPPYSYLTGLRIDAARRALAGAGTLADVALASGFSDQSHFTRQFKRFTGLTPGQYRAGCKIVQDPAHTAR